MIFSSKASPRWPRAVAGLMCAAALALFGACGGGTEQYQSFTPGRLYAFGDDASVLTGSGRKYAVNGVDSSGAIDCSLEPIWVQTVAASYGFVFAECNPSNVSEPQAHTYAAAGAKVGDVAAQVDAQVAAGGFRDTDLVLVLAGANDILGLYADYPLRNEADLLADAAARGRELAQVVNRLAALGAKVVVSNLPDLGLSPYARAERSANSDTDRAALITRLITAFNEQLGITVLQDGRYVGLMQADLRFQTADRSPASFGLVNVADAVCTAVLPNCTTATLVASATASQYLWADATRLSTGGHAQLGSLAVTRARGNPF
jgi:phospholipase/lecithinase/hemolysin